MTPYSRLAPCIVLRNDAGERVFIDPSVTWPDRKAASPPHIRGHQTRKAPTLELARAMRRHLGLGA